MNAVISFEGNFRNKVCGPLWLIWTPENKAWFVKQRDLIEGSALFLNSPSETALETLLRVLGDVEDHHPESSSVLVRGLALPQSDTAKLSREGYELQPGTRTEDSFELNRTRMD